MSTDTLRVFIVDDEAPARARMKALLADIAVELPNECVGEAANGIEALERLEASPADVALVDIRMPKMDGIELIKQIRRADSDVAVVVFAGYPSVETAVDALKLNVSDYIKKPFDVDEFREKIADVLRRKGLLLNPEAELHRTIGHNIRRIRKEKELTLKQLARRTSLSVSLLSQIERAESSASVSSLYKVAVALGVKLTVLFGEY